MNSNPNAPAWADDEAEIVQPAQPATSAPAETKSAPKAETTVTEFVEQKSVAAKPLEATSAETDDDDLPAVQAATVAAPATEPEPPKTIAEALVMLKAANEMPWSTKAEIRAKEKALRFAQNHHHRLCNVLPGPTPPPNLCSRAQAILAKVIAGSAVPIGKLKEAVAAYHCVYDSLRDQALLPHEQKGHLVLIENAINSAASADEINELLAKKARVLLIEQTPTASAVAVRQINNSFDAVHKCVVELEAAFVQAVDEQEAKLTAVEREFFESQGVSFQRTEISSVVANVRNYLKEMTAATHNQVVSFSRSAHPFTIRAIAKNEFAELFQAAP